MSSAPAQPAPFLEAFRALLESFRQRPTRARTAESALLNEVLEPLHRDWDNAYPGFPSHRHPQASVRGILRRGRRDAYLRSLIVRLLGAETATSSTRILVNPACVFGRHARDLAFQLPSFRVVGTDINPTFDKLHARTHRSHQPTNYTFKQDDIFHPELSMTPTDVVFFGACGSISDAAMEYAIRNRVNHLICRTCCHENIGGNTHAAWRFTPLNGAFQVKNLIFERIRRRNTGEYFSADYGPRTYPRSAAGREECSSEEIIRFAQHSVDSDLCRSIIDLDRALRLIEQGYHVRYRGELFVAERLRCSAV